ncbi:5'-3' exonuclease [Pseudohongiella spirulinae]|uniref:5'-3' exonuclease, N-terminal resolvase-like domain family n=1 Tax=Pseudohongiella spirulinae TaxID=1249552 RepID=A0A0S2KCQ8_9GAMM|nr:5'-3' exonuclease H3TH domain-containing protein [Pseudohongiella spirulinae]ALO46081.1 5'-3' exonuclease, N-terminal resolvase-like domain family [Pseudohongiella spirulinae]
MKESLYLIDASIYVFQAHFSPYQQSFSITGHDRSAFVGFSRFLLRLLHSIRQESKNSSVAVAFDESLFSGFRHQLYQDYKSNRVLPDENLSLQLKACQQLCNVLGAKSFASQAYEADDIIGTLKRRVAGPSAVKIVSRDKDLAQLLSNESDRLVDMQSRMSRSRVDIFEQYGIWPEQFPCYLGLVGDAVDCIPGVPGIGPVTARSLLSHFVNLDDLYGRLSEIPNLKFRGAGRCGDKLQQYEEQALLSRTLARICDTADEPFAALSAEHLLLESGNDTAFRELLRDMELDEYTYNSLVSQASL